MGHARDVQSAEKSVQMLPSECGGSEDRWGVREIAQYWNNGIMGANESSLYGK